MLSLFILGLYFTLLAIFSIASIFIVYHLIKYANGSEIKTIMLILFLIVSSGLFLFNLLLFFSINWSSLLLQITF